MREAHEQEIAQVVRTANEKLQRAADAAEKAKAGQVSSKLESIQQSYENARAEGGRELRNAKKSLETKSRDLEAELRRKLERALDGLEAQKARLSAEAQRIADAEKAMRDKASAASAAELALQRDLAAQKAGEHTRDVLALQAQIAALEEKMSALASSSETETKELLGQLQTTTKALDESRAEVARLRAELESALGEARVNESNRRKAEEGKRAEGARADMAEMARDEALRKVEKLSAEGDKLREALEALRREREQNDHWRADAERLEAELKALNDALASGSAEASGLSQELAVLRAQLDARNADLAALRSSLEDRESEILALRESGAEAAREHASAISKLKAEWETKMLGVHDTHAKERAALEREKVQIQTDLQAQLADAQAREAALR